ncbi:MAG: LysM peptidoglycan-binding domain-containing protein [Chromatiales bacterium]|nr:LysM peptidoglycan-binding domain-containing protein [Chromatiales bacterium]
MTAPYIVQPRDTLSAIAARFGIAWPELYAMNRAVVGPNPDLIYEGQVLQVPVVVSPAPAPGFIKTDPGKDDGYKQDAGGISPVLLVGGALLAWLFMS